MDLKSQILANLSMACFANINTYQKGVTMAGCVDKATLTSLVCEEFEEKQKYKRSKESAVKIKDYIGPMLA
jgi:hypothetical protein